MINATLSLSLVENELTRLHVIQKAIAEFANNADTMGDEGMEPGGSFDKSLEDIAKALKPDISDQDVKKCAHLPILAVAARVADNITFLLLSSLKLAQGAPETETENGISADFLIESARQNKTGEPDKEEFIKNLPWLIQTVLDYLSSDVDYQDHLTSGSAVAMRMLACILQCLEANGFKVVDPTGGTKTPGNNNVIILNSLPGLQS